MGLSYLLIQCIILTTCRVNAGKPQESLGKSWVLPQEESPGLQEVGHFISHSDRQFVSVIHLFQQRLALMMSNMCPTY